MSKTTEAAEERIPSYEESIANSSPPQQTSSSKTIQHNSLHQRTQQERHRRISNLIVDHIEPSITTNLNDGITRLILVLVPADVFPKTPPLTDKNITSPHLPHPTTLIHLTSPDYKSSFLHQFHFVSDLADLLTSTISSPTSSPSTRQPYLSPNVTTPSPTATQSPSLTPRPEAKSWLRRTFTLPPATHDPTGTTGAWKLGWRSEEDPSAATKTVRTGDVVVSTRLEIVTFRTESEMGLWESRGVRCGWLDLEFL